MQELKEILDNREFSNIKEYIESDKFMKEIPYDKLKEYERTLYLYLYTDVIKTDDYGNLYSKNNKDFNRNIILYEEGLINYTDFLKEEQIAIENNANIQIL